MINVGIVGLDTSHPEKFASLLGERPDTTVSAVWDSGDVRSESYLNEFCTDHEAAKYTDPHSMIGEVDAVMVLTVDWMTHGPLAVPFLESGVPTLVDKPIAGTASTVDMIETAASAGNAPLVGGSAVPFHPDVARLVETDPETTFCVGYGDPFYYGVHLTDTVRRLTTDDWNRVEPVNDNGKMVTVHFDDGATASIQFDGSDEDGTFGFLTMGERTCTATVGNTESELNRMYDPYIDAFVEAARGNRDDCRQLVDASRLLIGVQTALESGSVVPREDETIALTKVPSEPFVANYEPYY